jgi:hypothetical protein
MRFAIEIGRVVAAAKPTRAKSTRKPTRSTDMPTAPHTHIHAQVPSSDGTPSPSQQQEAVVKQQAASSKHPQALAHAPHAAGRR